MEQRRRRRAALVLAIGVSSIAAFWLLGLDSTIEFGADRATSGTPEAATEPAPDRARPDHDSPAVRTDAAGVAPRGLVVRAGVTPAGGRWMRPLHAPSGGGSLLLDARRPKWPIVLDERGAVSREELVAEAYALRWDDSSLALFPVDPAQTTIDLPAVHPVTIHLRPAGGEATIAVESATLSRFADKRATSDSVFRRDWTRDVDVQAAPPSSPMWLSAFRARVQAGTAARFELPAGTHRLEAVDVDFGFLLRPREFSVPEQTELVLELESVRVADLAEPAAPRPIADVVLVLHDPSGGRGTAEVRLSKQRTGKRHRIAYDFPGPFSDGDVYAVKIRWKDGGEWQSAYSAWHELPLYLDPR